jgi:hypothetical protein
MEEIMSGKKDSRPGTGSGDTIHIGIGDNARNVAAGKDIQQLVGDQAQMQISEADISDVRELFAELRRQIATEAPPEVKEAAVERVTELEEAVTAKKPDLTTMEYVKQWFAKRIPQLLGTVVSVLVNPVVGKVVEAGGEIAAGELKKRFEQ